MATIWSDNFNRTVSNGWGSAWSATTSHYSVNGSVGVVTATTTGTLSNQKVTAPSNADIDFTFQAGKISTPVGGEAGLRLIFRSNSTGTEAYVVSLRTTTSSTLTIIIQSVSASTTPTTLTLGSTDGISIPSGLQNYRIQIIGYKIRVKVWGIGAQEPSSWNLEVTDSNTLHASSGEFFNQVQHFTGSTNFSAFHFDNFTWTNLFPVVGSTNLELGIDAKVNQKASTIIGLELDSQNQATANKESSTALDLEVHLAQNYTSTKHASATSNLEIGADATSSPSKTASSNIGIDLAATSSPYKLAVVDAALDVDLDFNSITAPQTVSELGVDLSISGTSVGRKQASTELAIELNMSGSPHKIVPVGFGFDLDLTSTATAKKKASTTLEIVIEAPIVGSATKQAFVALGVDLGISLVGAVPEQKSVATVIEIDLGLSGITVAPVFIDDTSIEAILVDRSLQPLQPSTQVEAVALDTSLEPIEASTELTSVPLTTDLETV